MISVITPESIPECHPAMIFANSHPKTYWLSPLVQNFCLERMIWIVAKGAKIRKAISGRPIAIPMNLKPRV